MNGLTILITGILAVLTFVSPRKYFVVPFILAACFVPADQRIIIMGLDFTVLRVLVLAGIVRILMYGQWIRIKWNNFDKLLFIWAFCGAFIYTLQWSTGEAAVNRLGVLFDVLGLYWLFRQTIRSWDDIKFMISVLAFCMVMLAPFVLVELATKHNPFAALGRVITNVREERLRCQAAFPHSIMLGVFCSTQVPLFVGMAKIQRNKTLYYAAILASIFIVSATASSTPILVLAAGLLIISGFKWRHFTGVVLIIFGVAVLGLQTIMNAPVWHLLARINVVGGSTGWHRYNLINQSMVHINEWIFLGCRSTGHWGFGLEDITNQFLLEGLRGGLITMLIFIAMIFIGMKSILNFSLTVDDYDKRFFSWCCFVVMLAHCIAFFGVSYFGQMTMLWYMMLAVVGLLVEYNSYFAINHAPVANATYFSFAQP